MADILVSVVAHAGATTTTDAGIQKLFREIKGGKWSGAISGIRAEYSLAVSEGRDPKKAVAQLKQRLPGVLWSGRFTSRKKPAAEKLLAHSGLLCADLDELGERLLDVRTKIVASPHLVALFSSPTGNGLKAVFRVAAEAAAHATNYRAVETHVQELAGIQIDRACKDVTRLCYVSYDPQLWQNPAEPEELVGCGLSFIRLNTESCIPVSLHPCKAASLDVCIPASLHNKTDSVLANIRAKRESLDTLATKHPGLVRVYTTLFESRYHAQAHTRNNFITQAVPFSYRAVAKNVVLELVGCFYDCNRALFSDPREQHMKEAQAMLESVTKTYTESLATEERNIYEELPENEQDAFRICRDLALLEKLRNERGVFFMSFNQLGDRLGIFPMQAQRIMRQLESYGLIITTKKGVRRAAGIRGEAGMYRWLLVPEKGQI